MPLFFFGIMPFLTTVSVFYVAKEGEFLQPEKKPQKSMQYKLRQVYIKAFGFT